MRSRFSLTKFRRSAVLARLPVPAGAELIASAVAHSCRSRGAAAIFALLVAGQASAQTVWVPCGLPIAAMAPVHFTPHPIVRHVAHRGGRHGVMRALHLVANRAMCAVWQGIGLTNESLNDAYARSFGGDWPSGGGGGGGGDDFGGAGPFGDFGGGGFGGQGGTPPILVFFTPETPTTPLLPLVPVTPATPVPEPSTLVLMLIGFACIGFSIFRQRLATVSQWRRRD